MLRTRIDSPMLRILEASSFSDVLAHVRELPNDDWLETTQEAQHALDNPPSSEPVWEQDPWRKFDHASYMLAHGGRESYKKAIQTTLATFPHLPTPQPSFAYEVAGMSPNVGLCLSGDPEHMLVRRDSFETSHPIKLFLPMFVSCSLPAEHVISRAITAFAYANSLATVRPVHLHIAHTISKNGQDGAVILTYPIGTSPFDLGLLATLASPEFQRSYGHLIERSISRDMYRAIPIAWGRLGAQTEKWVSKFREMMELSPQDIIVPPGYSHHAWGNPQHTLDYLKKVNPMMETNG